MTYERAREILETCRNLAPTVRVYERELIKAQEKIAVEQKLTATYGQERVKGGIKITGLDDLLIQAESKAEFYKKKLMECAEVQRRAEIIMNALPKKYWKVIRAYYIRGMTVYEICKLKHWTSRTSVYNQLERFDACMKEAFGSDK